MSQGKGLKNRDVAFEKCNLKHIRLQRYALVHRAQQFSRVSCITVNVLMVSLSFIVFNINTMYFL